MAGSQGEIEIRQDNTAVIKSAINTNLARALEACGLHAESLAKKLSC